MVCNENVVSMDKQTEDAVTKPSTLSSAGNTNNEAFGQETFVQETFVQETFVQETFAQKVQQFLSLNLPGYCMPNTVSLRNSFPVTSHGKVDRQKLRESLQHEKDKSCDNSESNDQPINEERPVDLREICRICVGKCKVKREVVFFI